MNGAPEPAESGLQRERTALAWDRTGVAFMVVGALMLRVGTAPYTHPRHLPAALAIAGGGVLVAVSAMGEGRASGAAGEPQARPWLVRLVSVAAVGVSLASMVLVLLAL